MSKLSALLLGVAVAVMASASAMAETLDVLIKHGTVHDGTGAPAIKADVGIKDGKIVFVGETAGRTAATVVDAAGLVVAPGFIDPHTHIADAVLSSSQPLTNEQYLTQGVTTIGVGADGMFAPAMLRQLIEDLSNDGSGTNYACYVGHNGVRETIMKNDQRAPTAAELERMKALVREGMELGCLGLSTGLMYEPGMFSQTDEVIELAREVRSFGGIYESHTRDPVKRMIESEREAIEVGARAGVPARLGHLKAVGVENRGRIDDVIEMVEAERARGREVTADQYPYDGAQTSLLSGVFVLPEHVGAGDVSPAILRDALLAARANPQRNAAIESATEHGVSGGFSWVKAVGYGSFRIVDSPMRPALTGKNILLLARERGQEPYDLLVELFLDGGEGIRITFGSVEETDVQRLLVKPWVMIGSDGNVVSESRGHPRSTGSFTRVLGHYSRDLKLLPLQEAIRKMTSLPADSLRLYDRGRLAPGLVADVTIFDPATVSDRSDYVHPHRLSEGVRFVLVNGRFALRDGKPTGVVAGTFVPRQQRGAEQQSGGVSWNIQPDPTGRR